MRLDNHYMKQILKKQQQQTLSLEPRFWFSSFNPHLIHPSCVNSSKSALLPPPFPVRALLTIRNLRMHIKVVPSWLQKMAFRVRDPAFPGYFNNNCSISLRKEKQFYKVHAYIFNTGNCLDEKQRSSSLEG